MPGEEIPPNMDAARAIAYSFNFMGERGFFLDQFPVDASTDKVQKFCDTVDSTNISFRFDETLYL